MMGAVNEEITWDTSIERWKGFLIHASEISGTQLRPTIYGPVLLETSRFSFYAVNMPQYPLQFSCEMEDKQEDIIDVNNIHNPAIALIDWRRQIQEAIAEGQLTDFRTITTLTAILAYQP